ncbi:afadin isoform X1 [Patella vulgata]|uniref:afadin isoform X1 n=1 Tax=Patella vulgata TaxID=6465 RepID=UPI0021800626|nr:afadin isoform X1 [Patella vulgata]
MTQVKPSSEDLQRLSQLISQWNVDHYDLFELSKPNEALEFHGVVRFFFQGGGAHVVTKCIRVSSTATTKEVIDVLIEKFRPDMRMLTQNRYALYEVHVNGEERRLMDEEKPLFVQLNWGKDVREGRFLLKNENEPTIRQGQEVEREPQGFKRNLSKREKKELKKKREKEKKEAKATGTGVAEKLYNDLPENSFTRSISNPEAVMRRRRQQKLEKKMEQMRAEEGRSDAVETTCGTLKIYGESVRPDVPYKTLLLSTGDTCSMVVKEALEKYSLPNEDPELYCLYQVLIANGQEYHGGSVGEERLLDDTECPLAIVMQHPKNRGHIIFQLRRKPTHLKKKTKRAVSHDDLRQNNREPQNLSQDRLPYLQELNTRDGRGKRHHLPLNVTEIGSERSMSNSNQYLQLLGNDIKPRHCVVAHTEGIVTVTPTSRDAETYVENTRIFETTMLKHGMVLQFGKHHVYRFCDPRFDEMPPGRTVVDGPLQKSGFSPGRPHETNFDVDGQVEPINNLSPKPAPRKQNEWNDLQRSPQSPSPKGMQPGLVQPDNLLPVTLDFRDDAEDALLSAVILDVNSRAVQFKLASTYTLYMAMRHLLAQRYQRPQRTTDFVRKISKLVQRAIQDQHNDPTALAFWMANASEILHFFKMDRDTHQYSPEAHEMLAEAVQMAFHHLVRCLQGDLQRVMSAFLDPSEMVEDEMMDQQRMNPNRPTLGDVLTTLSAAMTLLRRCRVNAALTIQLFSQLFHFINMWLFNMIVSEPQLQMCTAQWGIRLKRRLGKIEMWAEKQGLELAADCHLCRIIQAAHLLQAPKMTSDDVTNISSTCFKLNSEQLKCLLSQYIPEDNEPPISHQFIQRLVSIAESMADLSTRSEGREVMLEEDQDLHLPFLLPEDGYSCDNIRGIPNGLPEFIKPLTNSGICQMIPNNNSSGSWTVYMGGEPRSLESTPPKSQGMPSPLPGIQQQGLPRDPEIMVVAFNKVERSMGLSIVAATGDKQRERGIYIKSVVPNGAAALDGRLQTGDQLLEVDGRSLVGVTQERAAELMRETGDRVTLKVAKQGAIYHGLATFLSQASPTLQRAAGTPQKSDPQMNGRRPFNEEAPPPYTDGPKDMGRMEIPRSQSSPRPQQMPIPQQRVLKPQPRSAVEQLMGPNSSSPLQQRHQDPNFRRDMHDMDPRSKSTSNLVQDPSYNRNYDPHSMKPAASVSVLHHPQGQGHYPPGVRRDNPQYGDRNPDYENQLNISSAPNGRPIIDTQKGGRDPRFQDMNHNLMPGKAQGPPPSQAYLHPNQRPADRSSMSSRTSSSSNRDNVRPQSAYFDPQNRNEDLSQLRPKSVEITSNKIQEWQNKMEDTPQVYRNDYDSGKAENSPPYSNIERDSNINGFTNRPYVSAQDIPRIMNDSERPNFYENASQPDLRNSYTQPPRNENISQPNLRNSYNPPSRNETISQPDLRNPYNQSSRPEIDMKPKPKVAPKPAVVPKPGPMPNQPVESPYVRVEKLQQSPSNFSRPINGAGPNFNTHVVQQPIPYNQSDLRNRQDGRIQDPRTPPDQRSQQSFNQKFSPVRENGGLNYRDPSDFPPPPTAETPPDLPPPPVLDHLHEESPPLPPPPNPQDFMLDQQLQEEKRRLQQQMNENEQQRRLGPGAYPTDRRGPQPSSDQDSYKVQPNIPNYQNINFNNMNGGKNQPPPVPQLPAEHNVYEPYEPKKSPNFQKPNQERPQSWQQGQATHLTVGDPEYSAASPWVREKKEKDAEEQEELASRLRLQEIAVLESKSYLNMQEQERLRKLRLEHEFQRRVKEVVDKGEYDEDSDSESADRIYSRERMIEQMQDDLAKARARMEELDRRRLHDDFEREKERMQRLERRLEMFEKEREEQRQRSQKRQERKQREHAEHLKKQRELHDKQRQNYEEQKRLLLAEEERMKQRREEEINKRRLMERERLQELQAQRDIEEKQLRAEARQREEEYSRQRLLQQQQQRIHQQREIKVSEERRRIDTINTQNQSHNDAYQQYANLPPNSIGKENQAPPPPERNSSYDLFNQQRQNANMPHDDYQGMNSRDLGPPGYRSDLSAPKKSVSFNTQLETNVYSDNERSPLNSQSSYRSSQSSEHNVTTSVSDSYNTSSNEVFDSPSQQNNITYLSSESTPGVIGAQEVYRDPRSRIIEAKKAHDNPIKKQADRMSFRDKMKYFAKEAGEDTIKKRPKSSSTQRAIESQMNGQ